MRRVLIAALTAVAVAAVSFFIASAVAQQTHVVKALDVPESGPIEDNIWEPGLRSDHPEPFEVQVGETVSWEFDQARTVHNLLLRLPNGDDEELSQAACPPNGICQPGPDGADPITYQIEPDADEGTYVYYCTLHGGTPDGENGMAGEFFLGDPDGGGVDAMPNPTTPPGPPWEAGTEPPRLQNVLVRGVNRGIRLRARLSHPGKLVVRMRRGGRVVLTRRYRRLPEGVMRDRIHSSRLDRGRHLVVIRGRDKWGQKARPQLIRERIWVNY